jgi:AcrR family transcriptional regulator
MARKYDMQKRAEQQEDTRRRIVEATVALHRDVGPARTQLSEIARLAGVQRPTVYRHFPDEASLLGACSAHYAAQHPAPDPAAWAAVRDPRERLRVALTELYAYYRETEAMSAHVMRDAEVMPALREVVEAGFGPWLAAAQEALTQGWGARGVHRRRLAAAVGLALDFAAWRALARGGGDLSPDDVVEVMAGAVMAAAS